MIPFPWVKFHLLPSPPYHHTLNKGILSPPHSPCPYSINPLPSPPHSVGQSAYCLTPFGYLPRALGQGNIIALTRGRSPSIDDNTHILEDIPKGPCTLVSLTSLMSSLDHLRGVLSASRHGCFSHARLQLYHRIVEIRIGFSPHSTWLKTPDVTWL